MVSLSKYIQKIICALLSEKSFSEDWLSKEDEKAWKHFQKEK